jgi:hypothetical protein
MASSLARTRNSVSGTTSAAIPQFRQIKSSGHLSECEDSSLFELEKQDWHVNPCLMQAKPEHAKLQ